MSKIEMTARDWYAEGLRIGAESKEERIISILVEEAARTSVGTFNANLVLLSIIKSLKEQGDKQ